jgi:energy-converting hydrogenase Eha subunit H
LASSTPTASTSPVFATASATTLANWSRRAMAASAPLIGDSEMIATRSSSVSTGEFSRMGPATTISESRASRLMTSGGAWATSFSASATMRRTRTTWSRARRSSAS